MRDSSDLGRRSSGPSGHTRARRYSECAHAGRPAGCTSHRIPHRVTRGTEPTPPRPPEHQTSGTRAAAVPDAALRLRCAPRRPSKQDTGRVPAPSPPLPPGRGTVCTTLLRAREHRARPRARLFTEHLSAAALDHMFGWTPLLATHGRVSNRHCAAPSAMRPSSHPPSPMACPCRPRQETPLCRPNGPARRNNPGASCAGVRADIGQHRLP